MLRRRRGLLQHRRHRTPGGRTAARTLLHVLRAEMRRPDQLACSSVSSTSTGTGTGSSGQRCYRIVVVAAADAAAVAVVEVNTPLCER